MDADSTLQDNGMPAIAVPDWTCLGTIEAGDAAIAWQSELFSNPPPPLECLRTLEAARPGVHQVVRRLAQVYTAPVGPPTPGHVTALLKATRLWQSLARNYGALAKAARGKTGLEPQLGLICQRGIETSGQVLLEHYRARQALARGAWRGLHAWYAAAESWAVGEHPAEAPLALPGETQSPRQCFLGFALIELGNPYGHSGQQLEQLFAWSARFAAHVRLDGDGVPVKGVGVVLDQDYGPRPLSHATPGPHTRRLDTAGLDQALREAVSRLKQRSSPEELGLGRCLPQDCARRLVQLHRRWCAAGGARRHQRRDSGGMALSCAGFDAIHYYVSGAEFVQPPHVRTYSRSDFETISTFRYQLDPQQPLHVSAARTEHDAEHWTVLDQSVTGLRLIRHGEGVLLESRQLVAVLPPDGERFLLCQVSWLMYQNDGKVMVGVQLLPGTPQAICARHVGLGVSPSQPYARAFLLPGVATLGTPSALVLPNGWYAPSRIIELYVERRIEVRLGKRLDGGSDFDLVSFEPVAPKAAH